MKTLTSLCLKTIFRRCWHQFWRRLCIVEYDIFLSSKCDQCTHESAVWFWLVKHTYINFKGVQNRFLMNYYSFPIPSPTVGTELLSKDINNFKESIAIFLRASLQLRPVHPRPRPRMPGRRGAWPSWWIWNRSSVPLGEDWPRSRVWPRLTTRSETPSRLCLLR